MEQHHLDITLKTLRLMDLRGASGLLESRMRRGMGYAVAGTGCDARFDGEANVVGLDVSDEMFVWREETSRGLAVSASCWFCHADPRARQFLRSSSVRRVVLLLS